MKKNKKGFTLIELLAVIIILGVLMLVAIPSVTGYISSSRRSSYASTGSEFIKSVGVLVNKGTMPVFDKNTLYLFPIGNDETKSCIKLESGGRSPFNDSYTYAYVGAVYDGTSYDYYIISNDGANQGYRDDAENPSSTKDYAGQFIISSKRLEAEGGDLIKPGIKTNSILKNNYGNALTIVKPASGSNANWTGITTGDGNINDFITAKSISKVVLFAQSECENK